MAAWRVKKNLSRHSCLTAFLKQLSCGEFQQKLSGGWYDSGYVPVCQRGSLRVFQVKGDHILAACVCQVGLFRVPLIKGALITATQLVMGWCNKGQL